MPVHEKLLSALTRRYIKMQKRTPNIEQKKKAIISTYCIAEVCPTLEICQE